MAHVKHDQEPWPDTIKRLWPIARRDDGWLVIRTKAGKSHTIYESPPVCHKDAVEFVDDDEAKFVLPYTEIESVKAEHE